MICILHAILSNCVFSINVFLRFIPIACGSSLFHFHCHVIFHCVTESQITYLFHRPFLLRELCVSPQIFAIMNNTAWYILLHVLWNKCLEYMLQMELLARRVCKYSTLPDNTECFPKWVFQSIEVFSSTLLFITSWR